MKVSISNSAVNEFRKLEPKLTRDIKTQALRAGWSKDAVKSLKVKVLSDDIVVTYSASDAEIIENLEYGTRTTAPRAVFRTFNSKHSGEIVDAVERWAMGTLAEREG